MAVLVEAISVIIRREAIERRFRGGWAVFLRLVPNNTLCTDDELVRVGFMTPPDVGAFISELEAAGLAFVRDGQPVDLAVVDQITGPTAPAQWLQFDTPDTNGMKLSICWLTGQPPVEIAVPNGWTYENSLSAKPGFVPHDRLDERGTFLRHEGGLDVYLDRQTGKEMFIGRPSIAGKTEAALFTQLQAICHDTLNIDAQLQSTQDEPSRAPLLSKLNGEILPTVRQITESSGRQMAFAHFALGLVLRVLDRQVEAERAFRAANVLQAGVINTLNELVRCLGEQDKHTEALPFAREAVIADPDEAGAWANLAACLTHFGERDEAKVALDRALGLDPEDGVTHRVRDMWQQRFGV